MAIPHSPHVWCSVAVSDAYSNIWYSFDSSLNIYARVVLNLSLMPMVRLNTYSHILNTFDLMVNAATTNVMAARRHSNLWQHTANMRYCLSLCIRSLVFYKHPSLRDVYGYNLVGSHPGQHQQHHMYCFELSGYILPMVVQFQLAASTELHIDIPSSMRYGIMLC